ARLVRLRCAAWCDRDGARARGAVRDRGRDAGGAQGEDALVKGAPMSWLVLGCGYVGAHLTRALRADGESVRVCARDAARLAPLAALGAEVRALDLEAPGALDAAFAGLTAPVVVYSVPPAGDLIARAAAAARAAGARRFVYLGSTGIY